MKTFAGLLEGFAMYHIEHQRLDGF